MAFFLIRLQDIQNISITKESDGNIDSDVSDSWEKLLNDALQITTATPPLSISDLRFYTPKNTESRA